MDRDDSLAISGRSLTVSLAVPFEKAFSKLTREVRTEVLHLDALMRQIHGTRFKEPMFAKLATEARSAETLKRIYYGKGARKGWGWRDIGSSACIDHRRCGGCGVTGCTWARESCLPAAVVEFWRGTAGSYDKQSLTEAWQTVVRRLAAGEVIADGITWETLHMGLFPGLPLPDVCPWSTNHAPPGWSLKNFTRQLGPKAIYRAQQKGHAAAWELTPDVRMDLSQLRFLEAVVFDDHRLDFMVRVWDDRGRVQTVELWGLFAMDVATGAVIAFGLRPRINREDGTAMGLTIRDMQHLIADIVARYGYPTGYPMTLIVENAAAAVSTTVENLLKRLTNGQVIVRRTGVHFSDTLLGGYGERWGAPRGKAWLESWFHVLDIVLGYVKGQIGSNYMVKPGLLEGQKNAARKINAIVSARPELAAKLSAPFEWAADAHRLIKEAINICNARTDHDMARHDLITEWRWHESDPVAKPTTLRPGLAADIAEQVQMFLAMPPATQDTLINRYGAKRRESPAEKVLRLHDAAAFARITPDIFVDLYLDSVTATYKGGDVLDIEVKQGREKKVLRYTGHAHEMEIGQEVTCRLDTTRPGAGVWITDAKGVHLGQMAFARDPRMLHSDDVEQLQAALGAKRKAFGEIVNAASTRAARLGGRGQLAAITQDLEVLETVSLPAPAKTVEALPESSTLERAVMATKPRSKRRPVFTTPLRNPKPQEQAADPGFSFED